MKKIIKSSKRGLTFAFEPTESMSPGDKYEYCLEGNQIVIKPSKSGNMTISRKKSGNSYKSLIDIRASKVVNKLKDGDKIQIEIQKDKIIAHVYRAITLSRSSVVGINEVLQCEETETIVIPKIAVGDCFQLSFFDDNEGYYKRFGEQLNNIFTVLSLFSGCGMLDYPFAKDDRYKIVLANDIGNGQVASYRQNIGDVIVQRDIRELNIVPQVDLVLGGPSCKPFSNANRKTRLENHPDYFLINEYIRIVEQANPKVFAIENVPAFITTADGLILDTIISRLPKYEFTVKTIVDCDVGGYTIRKRAIIIGSRIGKVELSDIKTNSYKTVKEALDKVDASWYNYNDFSRSRLDTQKRMSYVRDGHNWTDVPDELKTKSIHSDYLLRLDADKPAPAIVNVRKACIMPPKAYVKQERTLSVAECSALMGFNKDFVYLGTLDEKQQQVANGVPYRIALFIKNAITKILTQSKAVCAAF